MGKARGRRGQPSGSLVWGRGGRRRRDRGSKRPEVALLTGGGNPAALGGGEEACKLHDAMGKLFVESIGVEVKRTRGLRGELPAVAMEMVAGSAPAGDGERVRAGEVRWEMGKLAGDSVRAEGGRRRELDEQGDGPAREQRWPVVEGPIRPGRGSVGLREGRRRCGTRLRRWEREELTIGARGRQESTTVAAELRSGFNGGRRWGADSGRGNTCSGSRKCGGVRGEARRLGLHRIEEGHRGMAGAMPAVAVLDSAPP